MWGVLVGVDPGAAVGLSDRPHDVASNRQSMGATAMELFTIVLHGIISSAPRDAIVKQQAQGRAIASLAPGLPGHSCCMCTYLWFCCLFRE